MHGGRLVARTLRRLRTGNVFALCGDHVNAILEGCAAEEIRIVDTRDERAAAHMAQGWSLATGAPGVCVVTGGPGLASAMGAIADASMAATPMLVVTSRIRAREEGRGFPQDVDAATIAGGVAEIVTIREPAGIARGVAGALDACVATRRPVVVEVALDAQLARADDEEPPRHAHAGVGRPLPGAGEAAALLRAAERPILIAGEGCFWGGGEPWMATIAEAAGIPVFTVRAARGLLPDAHDRCFAQPNFLREPVRAALERCDLLIVAGADLDITLAFGGIAPQARLVRIDRDPERVQRNRTPDVALVAPEAEGLAVIGGCARDAGSWPKEIHALFDAAPLDAGPASGSPVHPAALCDAVAGAVDGPATFAIDAGALALWALERLPATGPGRLLTSFGTPASTIGGGLSFAIAAKLARPDEPAIAVLGDGALGYQMLELDTAARHGVEVVAVVGNDASWGIVRQQMEASFGGSVTADLAPRRYDDAARALGAQAERVERAEDLPAALRRALAVRGGPTLLDVSLDRDARHAAMGFIAAMFAPDPDL